MSDLTDLRDRMRRFTTERNWEQFHDPKSLILALTGEVGELAEVFQWLPAGDARAMVRAEPTTTQARDELADVLLYLVRLADVLDVDLHAAALEKMSKNAVKHPPP
ncbi:nucleotide pyrophosphohydrolase [Propionibacteriaceae bacterium Y1700]|uniref:nucleotide pyrophosphohydrolase n=1 Tax=Microlunatus sp. Y1700 TaxID=3418487 RepID=UPI003DA6FA57